MITWMQKHRKYLVITIWIASISFIGAGFVGWGAYSMGQSGSTVAEVGDVEITVTELQQEYSNLYRLYNQMMGGKFDQEQAKKMGLQDQAMQKLITRATLLNFAEEIGLKVPEEEVAKKIASISGFQKDGKFDKEIYLEVLKQNRLKASEYEEMVVKDILVEKINNMFKVGLSPLEKETVNAAFGMEDNIKIAVKKMEDIVYTYNEEELKPYWEQNKEKYQTKKAYYLSAVILKPDIEAVSEVEAKEYYDSFKNKFTDAEGKIKPYEEAKEEVLTKVATENSRKSALKQYLDLKKGKHESAQSIVVFEDDTLYGTELLKALGAAKAEETIKPVLTEEGYVTAQLERVEPKRPMEYEQAKLMAKEDFIHAKKLELLKVEAENAKESFEGIQIGFVTRDNPEPLKAHLSEDEARQFLQFVFESKAPKGVLMLADKAVVFEILEQRLLPTGIEDQNTEFVNQNTLRLKQRLIEDSLIKTLQKRYKEETKVL